MRNDIFTRFTQQEIGTAKEKVRDPLTQVHRKVSKLKKKKKQTLKYKSRKVTTDIGQLKSIQTDKQNF